MKFYFKTFIASILLGLTVLLGLGPFNFFISGFINGLVLIYITKKIKNRSFKQKILVSILISVCITSITFQWVFYSVYLLSNGKFSLTILSFLIYTLISNFKIVFFIFLYSFMNRKYKISILVLVPVLFFVLDKFTYQVFPWYFGNLISGNLYLSQVASIAGVFGLSYLTGIYSTLLYILCIYLKKNKIRFLNKKNFYFSKPKILIQFYLLVIISSILYSIHRVHFFEPTQGKTIHASMIQPSTKKATLENKSDENFVNESLNTVFNISLKSILDSNGKIDLLILPESAVPFHGTRIQSKSEEKIIYSNSFHGVVSYLSRIGKLTVVYNELDFKNSNDYNLITSLLPFDDEKYNYTKQILMPFGEFLPFEKNFPILRKIFPEAGIYKSGNEFTILPYTIKKNKFNPKQNFSLESLKDINNPQKILSNKFLREDFEHGKFLGLICYEAMFTENVWEFFSRNENIDFIVNITNDSWFGEYLENYQHDSVVRLRAIEFGKSFLRPTLTGITTAYNYLGEEIIPPSKILDSTSRIVEVPVLTSETIYKKYKEKSIYLIILISLLIQYIHFFKFRK